MQENTAAWIEAPFGSLVVGPAAFPSPGPGQIVVRTRAVAVNPIDRYIRNLGGALYGWRKFPYIAGFDLAGEVVLTGETVTRFKPGDRVLALATGMEKSRNSSAESAFQHYSLVSAHLAAAIPEDVSFEQASVLPLAISTAAVGLFDPAHLGLERPAPGVAERGRTVLIWSGSSSVGGNSVQLAARAGYRVVSTSAPRNFDRVRQLGAAAVFDHHAPDIVAQVRTALEGHEIAGALAIGPGAASACIDLVPGTRVAQTSFPIDIDDLPDRPGRLTLMIHMLPRLVMASAGLWLRARRNSVSLSTIWGTSLMSTPLGPALFEDDLPAALASRAHIPFPEPLVCGDGLAALETAFARQAEGLSARKAVITL